jgi:hypothetical protein
MEFSENIEKFVFIFIILCVFAMLIRHLFFNVGESEISSYIKKNYIYIIGIITTIVTLIVIFNIVGIEFKNKESTLNGQYVVENMKSDYLPETFWRTKGKGFCQAVTNDINKHKKACKKLSFSNCSQFVGCCAAANGFNQDSYDCVPTTSSGSPIFSKDNYNQNIDLYWYKGKCNGNVCNYNADQIKKWKSEYKRKRTNVEEKQEIVNEAEKEAKENEENECQSQQKSCYLWGIPDANISPFG